MDEYRFSDNGNVLPLIEGPDGRALDDADVADGFAIANGSAGQGSSATGSSADYLASVEAERKQYDLAGDADGVAACDQEIRAAGAAIAERAPRELPEPAQ